MIKELIILDLITKWNILLLLYSESDLPKHIRGEEIEYKEIQFSIFFN